MFCFITMSYLNRDPNATHRSDIPWSWSIPGNHTLLWVGRDLWCSDVVYQVNSALIWAVEVTEQAPSGTSLVMLASCMILLASLLGGKGTTTLYEY